MIERSYSFDELEHTNADARVLRWEHVAESWARNHASGLLAMGEPRAGATAQVGFIGLSGVGKSSLLNALVSPGTQLSPAGGIGPLTGSPVRISYGNPPRAVIRYRTRAWLQSMLVRIEQGDLDSEDLGRLSLACTGDQYRERDPGWLHGALAHVASPRTVAPPTDDLAIRAAMRDLVLIVDEDRRELVIDASQEPEAFFQEVQRHTCGQFAPLCESIDLEWPSAALGELRGTLIDLPGLGASHDSHARLALEWLQTGTQVVIVVDRSGMPDPIAIALRDSGFLSRWLERRASLTVAITKLDLVADDARRLEKQTRISSPWSRHFFAAAKIGEQAMRAQMRTLLARLGHSDDSASRADQLRVVAVSSRERHRLEDEDQEVQPRVRSPESTGIPELHRVLRAMTRLADPFTQALDRTLRVNGNVELVEAWDAALEQEGVV